MLKKYHIHQGRFTETTEDNAQLFVYINPDDQEKNYLIHDMKVDEHTLNSSFDPDELGRLEMEEYHLALIVKRPKKYCANDNFVFKVSSTGLFLFMDKLVVVFPDEDIQWDSKVFLKVNSTRDILLRVVYHYIVHFEDHLKIIRKISEELETEINHAVTNKDLLHMFKLSKGLVYYVDAINSNAKVIEKLKIHAPKYALTPDMVDFLDDLIIECSQCLKQAESYAAVLSDMTDAFASIINNNLNIRLKRLTVVSICIMTPTFVVSLFSMNVTLPLPHDGGLMSFWIVLALSTISVLGLILIGIFKKL